jgi:hypothetical protein
MCAFDDLAGTTLAAVSGVLGKLEYISHLRKGAGKPYSHWGLSRVYGEAAAQEALAEAHRLLFLRILHTPLRQFSSVLLALSTLVSRRTKTLADTTDRV